VPIVAGDIYCSVLADEVGALVPPATGPVIGYMGTGGHSADLALILPAIGELMNQLPSLNFELFGTIKMPAELAGFGSRVRHLPPVADYAKFRSQLRSLGWWVGLAPLEDNPFNRCKADTKWVEYSLAGMAVVASNLPVYHRACGDGCGILASTPDEWARAVADLLYRPDARQRMIAAAQAKLRASYSREKLRAQVIQVFEQAFHAQRP
jgi:glycosyltransferase involved in cell wall biosynthesis